MLSGKHHMLLFHLLACLPHPHRGLADLDYCAGLSEWQLLMHQMPAGEPVGTDHACCCSVCPHIVVVVGFMDIMPPECCHSGKA